MDKDSVVSYCCDAFRQSAESGQFEWLHGAGWAIGGCCHGGCFVVSTMSFCPYCGTRLQAPAVQSGMALYGS